jgi:isoquinoline 1-oxidoreductase beta subunit
MLTRRRFVLGVAVVGGGGLALTWLTRQKDSLAESPDVLEPNAFLQITPDGRCIFQLDKVEMGQGTMTGLLTMVAEELDLDPARFEVSFAPVMGTFQRPMQMTGQSRSTVDSWEILRETGATARAMLLTAAAERWGVPREELQTEDGRVFHQASDSSTVYAELAAEAARLSPPLFVSLKKPSAYRWIGTDVPRKDTPDKVTGAAVYGIDVQPEGCLTAVVARVPELGAVLSGFDSSAAGEVVGVQGFVELPHGVAAVADNFWAATSAAKLIELEWQSGPLAGIGDAQLHEQQQAQFARSESDYMRADGDSSAALKSASRVLECEYRTPYLAHAPMEPMNATVHVQGDRCDVWVPSQAPDMAQNIVSEVTGVPREQVNVRTTYLGGGFGRRVLWDYVLEAALVAREFDVPVKTVWSREDDIRHGYFRQQTQHRVRAGLDEQGRILGWEHRQVATPTAKILMGPSARTLLPDSLEVETRKRIGDWMTEKSIQLVAAFQAREGAEKLIYDVPDMSFIQYAHDPGVPVSIWRSVGNSYNAFVVESLMDELAFAAGVDPAEYRLERLRDERHRAVLEHLLARTNWGEVPEGRAQGVALFESFGTIVGQVAEVSVSGRSVKKIRVHRVSCVVDCGRAITPDIVRQQMQSGIIFGLTAALYGEINISDGRVQQSNFHDYRMVRMQDAPEIDVYVMDSEADPSGVGEPGLPPIAPAVANAVFALTGKRLRTLPLRLS